MRLAVVLPQGAPALELSPEQASLDLRLLGSGVTLCLTSAANVLPPCDGVVLTTEPEANSVVASQIRARALDGVPVLGLGAGFAALCTWAVLPGRLAPAAIGAVSQGGACAEQISAPSPLTCVRVEGQLTPFTACIPAGRVLRLPHSFVAAYRCADVLALERAGQVIFRYCDAWAGVGDKHNPYAAQAAIAGICNQAGNVVGLVLDVPPLCPRTAVAADDTEALRASAAQMFASVARWMGKNNDTQPASGLSL